MSLLPVYALCRHRIMTDGFGVTTLVAVCGCPLKCTYCINPEARSVGVKTKMYTPESLFDALRIDDLYFQATGGGVTFGGGEPLMHADFIRDFIELVGGRWKVNVETSLNVPTENALVNADMYICDIKDMDADVYKAYTGGDIGIVKSNLKRVVSEFGSERVIVRVPHIKDYNTDEHVQKSIEALKKSGVEKFDEFTYTIRS